MDLVTINPNDFLKFVKSDSGTLPTAKMEIINKSSTTNAAYKVKTTAPNLFVVKPIQGIIAPNRSMVVEVFLQTTKITSVADVIKHKFMIQATPTEI